MNKIVLLVALFVSMFSLMYVGVKAEDITGCTYINTSGTYNLRTNLWNVDDNDCMNITASNVIFDCNNYTIDGDRDPEFTHAIVSYSSQSREIYNLTIQNCYLQEFHESIYIGWVSGLRLINVHVNYTYYGYNIWKTAILIAGGNNTFIRDIDLQYSSYNGMGLTTNYNDIKDVSHYMIGGDSGGCSLWLGGNHTIVNNYTSRMDRRPLCYVWPQHWNITTINSHISDMHPSGGSCLFDFGEGVGYWNDHILFYNNVFNVSFPNDLQDHCLVETSDWPPAGYPVVDFNVAVTPGINIVGGINFGGNYWAAHNHTGFSDTCVDANNNDICDSTFSFTEGGEEENTYYDYAPLAFPDMVVTIDSPANASALTNPPVVHIPLNVTTNVDASSCTYQFCGYGEGCSETSYSLNITSAREWNVEINGYDDFHDRLVSGDVMINVSCISIFGDSAANYTEFTYSVIISPTVRQVPSQARELMFAVSVFLAIIVSFYAFNGMMKDESVENKIKIVFLLLLVVIVLGMISRAILGW